MSNMSFQTSHNDVELFSGFPMLSTSTPLRDDFNRNDEPAPTLHYLPLQSAAHESTIIET